MVVPARIALSASLSLRAIVLVTAVLWGCGGGNGSGVEAGSGSGGSSGNGGSDAAAGSIGVDGGGPLMPTYTPVAPGTPMGTATTQTVDVTGGTVTSGDGRLTITILPGALAAATLISIQPITNTAPNGVGASYRLSPAGTTFSQPVTIAFKLDALGALAIDSTFVATQHADGLWYAQPNQSRDSTAQTVSVPATHFSDWTMAQTLLLKPQTTRVRVTQKANFVATILVTASGGDDLAGPTAGEVAVPTEQDLNNQLKGVHTWQVNGTTGGTDTAGHIVDDNSLGHYTAPNQVPAANPVSVSCTVELGTTKVIAAAQAEIYTQEIWSGSSHITMTDGTVVDATFVFAQTSDDGQGHVQFNVQSGTVHAKVPTTLPNGCTQTATPTDYAIGTTDGTMTATYDYASGPDSPRVAGMGTTVWLANYVTDCPNGSGTMQVAIEAEWWPSELGSLPTPVEATDGKYMNAISTATASGIVNLTRQ